jgi:hypothetical protein
MRKIVELHLAKLRRAKQAPEELEHLRGRLVEHLYPPGEASVTPSRQERIPAEAPDWYFEAELRRSGLWEMMERCYPSTQSQSQ